MTRLTMGLALVASFGCSKPEGAQAIGSTPTPAPTSSVADFGGSGRGDPAAASDAGELADAGGDGVDRALALRAAYATASPLSGKSVGHTSVVFKLKLEGGLEAAYKPRSKSGGRRYRGEVAAYRLARSLSLENVPYATIREIDRGTLARAVGQEAIFAQVVPEGESDGGTASVRGALMPWIKGLEFASVDRPDAIGQWRAWLKVGGALPDDQRAMAAQISTMIAFDYVTGNWDRWSGGNIGLDKARGSLLFIDNDGAFFDPVPAKEMKRGSDFFDGVERFSRGFVAALRAVDLAHAMGEEVPGEPLLSDRVMAQTEARRRKALAAIDAKIARLGESAVLAFE